MKGLATMMQQLLQGQKIQGKALNQATTVINSRMNHMFNDLRSRICVRWTYDNVASHMRQMDVQIAHTADSVKRQQGTLRGKTDKNLKECSAVALRSGRTLPDAAPKKLSAAEKGKQKEGEQPQSEAGPYLTRNRNSLLRLIQTLLLHLLSLFLHANTLLRFHTLFQQRLLARIGRRQSITGDSELLFVSKECSAVLQNKQIKKLGDQGSSSVNLMPYSVAKQLGFTDFKPTRISLVFADTSVKLPVGILEDLHVRVGNTFVPTDFFGSRG
ncbi:uncharacterized protein LOC106377969 [Brassica napus]|uniref:uncharacterized protein LOC106377969 n=1 Tax=Brassica napus TaxID=3708 RepID=UPI0006AB45D2|nr:uncharacterized protein LOC106377969 [Brassica napus]